MLIGGNNVPRSLEAWRQTYRALEHKTAKNRCSEDFVSRFPQAIRDFANVFVALQVKRHVADYAPDATLYKSDVQQDIVDAENAIRRFLRVRAEHRRAFAAHLLFTRRP